MLDRALLSLRGMHGMMAVLVVFALVHAALVVGQALILSQTITDLWEGGALQDQMLPVAVFFACFFARHVVAFVQGELLDGYAGKVTADLREKLLKASFADGGSLSGDVGTASAAVAATEGIDEIARYVRVIPPKVCGLAGVSVPVLAALFAIDWVSGIIALVAFPVVFLFMIVLGKQARALAERRFGESSRLANRFVDALRGIDAIAALQAVQREAEDVFQCSEQLRVATVRTLSVAILSSAILDLVTVFGIAAISMMLAFRLMDAAIMLQPALAALMLAPEFFTPIRSFASDFHSSLDGKNALSAALGILESASPEPADDQPLPPWGPDTTLEVKGLSYRHAEDGPMALRDATFSCRGFQKIAVVGESGAGKSTLVNLLAGFAAPSKGSFNLDGIPLESLRCQSWRDQVHYIPQHPHLFRTTLEDNIRFYRPDATRREVEHVVHVVGLDGLLDELPQGLDTVLGAGQRGLSGGQAHRVALARVLLDDRKVLMLDEPTAHLDIQTELQLKRSMLECMEGRLVVLATHRLHWLEDMDLVVVLEDGIVVEAGPADELLARDGALRRFAEAQRAGEVA